MLTGQTFQQHQPMQMPQVMPALPFVIRPSPGRGARPRVFSCAIFTSSGRQESPSAPIIEATKKRDIETVTEVVGTKHARRAPDESSTSPKTIEPDTAQQFAPPWGVEAQELGDFGAPAL